nr:precorrin-4 C(11)-methyltransferase [uncultured Macellibacteroides sp.]
MKTGIAILVVSENSLALARTIAGDLPGSNLYSSFDSAATHPIPSIATFVKEHFNRFEAFVFIGSLGICVRTIAPYVMDKHTDPAIVNVDSTGKYVVSVLSGHIGGANSLTRQIARITGGQAIITTQSDNTDLWALDTLGKTYLWKESVHNATMNKLIASFVNKHPVALLLDIKDEGTDYLERTKPDHVTLFYRYEEIPQQNFEILIAVTPYLYSSGIPTLHFHPQVFHLGIGCRKNCFTQGIGNHIENAIRLQQLSPLSIRSISTIELKKDEPLLQELQAHFPDSVLHIYQADELKEINIPNPSDKVFEVTGVYGVAEASAKKSAGNGPLLIEKQKGILKEENDFTFALAQDTASYRKGHIEIVGAGPGDPELISVRGRRMLEAADLILYAGSLVPEELTHCAKQGAVVRSSATLNLEEQFELMKQFYDKGLFIVRLHTGDPCIYGAIQEQMAFFDTNGMSYHITPGISSFQAAAAALQSQFTIPEKVQTIILTRGEGRTPMPEKEKLHLLAKSQSTMCIFLSAGVADQVQEELLQHYPPTTPVAACYHLTWKDERIYRGELQNLAKIVKDNNLTLTTMIVVGEAIDNREGLSKLYSSNFHHLFR